MTSQPPEVWAAATEANIRAIKGHLNHQVRELCRTGCIDLAVASIEAFARTGYEEGHALDAVWNSYREEWAWQVAYDPIAEVREILDPEEQP